MFRRRRKKVSVHAVPMPVLIRQAIYDSIFEEHAEEIADMLGLSPVSKDVSEMEAIASSNRISSFASLIPIIDAHSDIAARIAASAYIIQAKEEGKDDFITGDNVEDLSGLFKLVSMSAAVSCISTLLHLDLIETKVSEDE
jgi:hypothetical protein